MSTEHHLTLAELWSTSADHTENEEVYAERWELCRLILQASERRPITREEVATWRMSDGTRPKATITLTDLLREAYSPHIRPRLEVARP